MKKLLTEFKEFAFKGNVMNLAVGVIIGAAFQGIVKSLTDNILSPLIGILTGQNFDSLKFNVRGAEIMYGAFITSVLNFFIMAFVVFLIVRTINKLLTKPEVPAAPTTQDCPYCFTVIDIRATRCSHCTSEIVTG